jgi:5-methyltetrahydropteroyltriglutamate--homocysteine methyltransferase
MGACHFPRNGLQEGEMALRTTVAGSWWPYEDGEADLARYHRGELSEEDGLAVLDRYAARAIAEQRELGFTEWTGGEYFMYLFIQHLPKVLTGITMDRPPEDDVFDYDDFGHVTITGDVGAPHGLGYADAYRREARLPGGVRKATVAGPFEALLDAADQQEAVQQQMPNLLRIVNTEIRALADAGCPHVQLDAPFLGIMVNQEAMKPAQAAAIVAACFEGVSGVTRGLHLCNGNSGGRPASAVLRNATWVPILRELDGIIDVASLEASYFSEYLEREAFRDLPQSMEFAAGIVDEASYWVEPVKKIKDRAADWARVVGEERLWIMPSCGLGRHAPRDRAVLEPKMINLNEAAASF